MEQQQQPPRGRGRARGRARGPPAGTGAVPRPGPQPPQQPPRGAWAAGPSSAPQAQQVTSAWGPKAQVQQQHLIRAPVPQPQLMHQGRALFRASGDGRTPGADTDMAAAIVGAGGDATSMPGRGALRGRRPLTDVSIYYRTKPEAVQSKQGSHGRVVKLRSNYFQLLKMTNWCLYQSRVDFAPDEDRTPIRKKLLRTALKDILPVYVFDGTVMYASRRLHPDPFEVFVDSEVEGEKMRITIRTVGELGEGDYHFLQFFNIIMRKCMGFLELQLVGRNFYDEKAKAIVPNWRMEVWPGYLTSIRQHEQSILMCCEITNKFMRTDTVLHLLNECLQEDHAQHKRLFHNRVIGTIVLTDYNNRTYHIDDIDWDSTPLSTFKRNDGSTISYMQYFKERYSVNITDKKQPMLVSRTKPREIRAGMPEIVYLVPELCRLTGLTPAQRANFQLMRALSEHTRVGPAIRIEKLRRFSQRLRTNEKIMTELRTWDMQLAEDLIQFDARVLPPENIICGAGNYSAGDQVNWTRDVRSRKQFTETSLDGWVIITPQRLKTAAERFAQCLNKCAQGMQWSLPRPKIFDLRDDRPGPYLEMLDIVIGKYNPSLILCVVSNNKADRYSAIKKKCCVDKAIPSQVVVGKSLESRDSMSIATKVAIQMNCKLGGAPWTLQIPISNLMIVGFDVCHDPQDKSKSYGALVASLDKQVTRYYSTTTAHCGGEEISNYFAVNMVKACKAYQRNAGRLPEKILIYRDGVGDGQIPYIKEHEVAHTKNALQKELYGDNLKLCFIIVSKRINTRFFKGDQNPDPGTVVDSCVTLPERYDFFIVSQCVRQGTVAPTSYNIIDDNMGLSTDHLQRLTYKLTHMYFNWSGTVRVPAPCQYAHKLAFLVSQNLHRTPNPELDTLLYYL
ncbi:aub [Trypoxylus dichotomus]